MKFIRTHSKSWTGMLVLAVIFTVFGAAYVMQKSHTANLLAKKAQAKSMAAANDIKVAQDQEKASENIPASEQAVSNPQVEASEPVSGPALAQTDIQQATAPAAETKSSYPVHKNISVTFFWAGEEAGADNKNISNLPSAWDDEWVKHFGGVDNPKKRNGFVVASFTPKENSFYFALPYNDFDENGNRKKDVNNMIPWAGDKKWGANESIVKNQWIAITKGGKTAYAQWEDVGPFGEDDSAYVFGGAKPKSKTNETAGLDVSPAAKDYLGLSDIDKVDWRFVKASEVPDGPWKKTTTSSQIYWN